VASDREKGRVCLGFVGLGAMGSRMALRLMGAGYPMTVYNRTREKAEALAEQGAQAAANPREVAAGSDVIFSSLSDDSALEAVMYGPDGLLAGVLPGTLLIDTSTVYPEVSQEIARAAWERQASMIDAPVAGTTIHLEQGSLKIFVGGEEESYRRAKPYLDILGNESFYMGSNGMGLRMKLVNNTLLGLGLQALAEALALGEKVGIDRNRLLDTLEKSDLVSAGHRPKLDNARRDGYPPDFGLRLMYKDFGLIMRQAAALAVPMPATAAAQQLCGAELGKGVEEDYSAVIRLMEELAGVGKRPY